MKDFQEQNLTLMQNKINELQEENANLKSKLLSEADVKMIVSKSLDNRNLLNSIGGEDSKRRNSQSSNEAIHLKIKGGSGRFTNNYNKGSSLRKSLAESNDSDQKKEPTNEL